MDQKEKEVRLMKDRKHHEGLMRQMEEKKERQRKEKEIEERIDATNEMMMKMGFVDQK